MARIPLDNPNIRILEEFETAAGNRIENCQSLVRMTDYQANCRRESFLKQFPLAQRRYERPNGVYNCHGMVFGARRTGIESKAINQILDDDKYQKVEPSQVLPGDVVLYLTPGDIEHTAIVIEPPSAQNAGYPLVFSKWGDYVEYVHYANACPYNSSNLEYRRAIP